MREICDRRSGVASYKYLVLCVSRFHRERFGGCGQGSAGFGSLGKERGDTTPYSRAADRESRLVVEEPSELFAKPPCPPEFAATRSGVGAGRATRKTEHAYNCQYGARPLIHSFNLV
jgi:hypothetical protein